MNQLEILKQIEGLQKESFNIKKKINNLEKLQKMLGIKEDMLSLIDILKDDFYTEEALKEEEEIENIINNEGNFDNFSINDAEYICTLNNIRFGYILYKYKDRGYILTSNNDGTFNYEGTAEALFGNLQVCENLLTGFQI